ncbi:hypothetical protein [Azospirillum sp. B510]|uniref:hypothetical protein n=1 Tax=Azospirillum sp. (strain B510) TaxID=137722 RepID=UPI0011D03A2C|nr:hypothetical protein [Azospirillum sp. B510]
MSSLLANGKPGRNSPPNLLRWIAPAVVTALFLAFAAGSFAYYAQHAFINADSWAVYDMARSFDEHFYQGVLIRQFHLNLDYGASYAFLGPILVYATEALTGLGAYSHYLISALAGLGALLLGGVILGKAAGERRSPAVTLATLLLAVTAFNVWEFYRDIYRASTIPIALFFILAAVAQFPRCGGLSAGRAALIGVTMGLAAMTRFDVNLLVAAFTMVILVTAGAHRFRAAAGYVGGVLLTISPWILFSLLVFGRVYASDNAIVAIAVKQLLSLDLIPPGEPTLFVDFSGWFARVSATGADFLRILEAMLARSPFAWLFLAAVPALALGLAIWGRAGRERKPATAGGAADGMMDEPLRYPLTLTLVAAAGLLLFIGPVATGYQINTRYYSMTFLLCALALIGWMLAGMTAAERRLGRRGPRLALEAVVTCLCLAGFPTMLREAFEQGWPPLHFNEANRFAEAHPTLMRCVPADGRTLLLFRYTSQTLQDGIRFGVLARRTVLIMPNNWPDVSTGRKLAFLRDARVSHVWLDEAESRDGLVVPEMVMEPMAGCPGFYRLAPPPGQATAGSPFPN